MHSSLGLGREVITVPRTSITVSHASDKCFTWIILFNRSDNHIQYTSTEAIFILIMRLGSRKKVSKLYWQAAVAELKLAV